MWYVKIIKCHKDTLWYKDRVGEEFLVKKVSSKTKSDEFKRSWVKIHNSNSLLLHVDDIERVEK